MQRLPALRGSLRIVAVLLAMMALTGGAALVKTEDAAAQAAPVTLVKTATPNTVGAGGTVNYTIVLTNTSAAQVFATQILDNLPATLINPANINITTTQPQVFPTCSISGTSGLRLLCLLGFGLNSGATVTVTFTATVIGTATPGTVIDNTANTTGSLASRGGTYSVTSASTAASRVTVGGPDLTVTKTSAPATVGAGDVVTHTITVTNSGTAAATIPAGATLVRDTLPAGSTYVSATTPAGYTCSAGGTTVDCTTSGADSIAVAGTRVFTLTTWAPNTAGAKTNSVVVDPNNAVTETNAGGTAETNNGPATSTFNVELANLTISKASSVAAGPGNAHTITYTLTVTNSPVTPVNAVVPNGAVLVTDTLFAGLTNITASGPAGYNCAVAGSVVNCTATARDTISPAGTRLFTITAQTTAAHCGVAVTNTATVDPNNAVPETTEGGTSNTTTDTIPCADLRLIDTDITDTPDPVAGGAQINYTISPANIGTAAATNVTVRITLPAGVTLVSATSTNSGTCSAIIPPNTINCTGLNFPIGSTQNISVAVTAPASLPAGQTDLTLTAQIDPDNAVPELLENNNLGTEVTAFGASQPDLCIAAAAPTATCGGINPAAGSLPSGSNQTFSIVVRNDPVAPSVAPANNVTVNITLIAGLSNASATGDSGFTCAAPVGNVITCSGGNIGNDSNATITLQATISAAQGQPVQFNVAVDPANNIAESNEANNNANPAYTAAAGASQVNLRFSGAQKDVEGNPATINSGANFTYRLFVHNDGPAPASNVVVRDILANGLTFVEALSTDGFSCSFAAPARTVTCTAATMPAGADATIRITVKAPTVTVNTNIDNQAEIDPGHTVLENNEGDNLSNILTVTIVPVLPDLCVDNNTCPPGGINPPGGVTTFPAGSTQQITVTVNNAGTGAATNVPLNITLISGLTFVANSIVATNGFGCNHALGVISCVGGNIPAGSNATITFQATVTGAVNSQAIVNASADPLNAIVEGAPGVEANNFTSATYLIVASNVDLGVVKTGPATVNGGSTFQYTLNLTNTGTDPATNVLVRDQMPAGFTFVSAVTVNGFTCVATGVPATGQTVNCSGGSLPAGANVNILLNVVAPNPAVATSYTNSVEVDPNHAIPDATPANNTSSWTLQVDPTLPDLCLVAACGTGGSKILLGGAATVAKSTAQSYVITVRNNGIATANNVVVTDQLDTTNLAYVSAFATNGFVCNQAAGLVTCSGGVIPAQSNAIITINVTVIGNVGNTITNRAVVDPNLTITETDETNNTSADVVVTIVDALLDLDFNPAAMTVTPALIGPGDEVTLSYTVRNNTITAPGAVATGVVIRHPIPAGATFVSATATNAFSCSLVSGAAVCTGNLVQGATTTVTLKVNAPTAAGVVNTTAEIDPSNTIAESNEANNTLAGTFTVVLPDLSVAFDTVGSCPATVTAGLAFSCNVVITNLAGSPAIRSGLAVRITIPNGLTIAPILPNPTGFNCFQNLQVITCNQVPGFTFPAGLATTTFTVNLVAPVTPPADGNPYTLMAEVNPFHTFNESSFANNFAQTTISLPSLPDLTSNVLPMNGTTNLVAPYPKTVMMLWQVTNTGSAVATNVTGQLNSFTSAVGTTTRYLMAASLNGGNCGFNNVTANGGRVTCNNMVIQPGQTVSIVVFAEVNVAALADTITFLSEIDPANAIVELDETNNNGFLVYVGT